MRRNDRARDLAMFSKTWRLLRNAGNDRVRRNDRARDLARLSETWRLLRKARNDRAKDLRCFQRLGDCFAKLAMTGRDAMTGREELFTDEAMPLI